MLLLTRSRNRSPSLSGWLMLPRPTRVAMTSPTPANERTSMFFPVFLPSTLPRKGRYHPENGTYLANMLHADALLQAGWEHYYYALKEMREIIDEYGRSDVEAAYTTILKQDECERSRRCAPTKGGDYDCGGPCTKRYRQLVLMDENDLKRALAEP